MHFGTRLNLFVCMVCLFMCEVALLPRDELRPRPPPSGLGIPPLLGRRLGLFLLPRNRFCVGDVGDFTISVVFGRADRLSGCVPSSYRSRQKRAWQKTDVNRCTPSAASLFFFFLSFSFFFFLELGELSLPRLHRSPLFPVNYRILVLTHTSSLDLSSLLFSSSLLSSPYPSILRSCATVIFLTVARRLCSH